MFSKNARWLFVVAGTLLLVLFGLLSQPEKVSADWQADSAANSCLTCHEDLYYLHDTGCWYCMTPVHKDRCTDCHEGNSTSMKMEVSHIGMIAHPQEQNGAKCLECHSEEEIKTRLETFDSELGFGVAIKANDYTPARTVSLGLTNVKEANPFLESWKWLTGGTLLFGFWLLLVLISPKKP